MIFFTQRGRQLAFGLGGLLGLSLGPIVSQAQTTTLRPGDLVITGVNVKDPDEFSFAPLVNVAAGTQIKFTDNGWQSSGGFRNTEGVATYTVPASGLARGTLITYNASRANPGFTLTDVNSQPFLLNSGGDQVFAFQGSVGSPSLICGITTGGPWTDAGSSSTSALPPALVTGVSALAIGAANAYHNQPAQRRGPVASLRNWFNSVSNWTGSSNSRQAWSSTAPFSQNLLVEDGVVPDADELLALQDLYVFTAGGAWTSHAGWPTTTPWPSTLTSADFATWEGLTVVNGDLSAIDLSYHRLVGTLPSSVGKLTQLTSLLIAGNQLQDEIPVELGALTKLQTLALANNQFTGLLPVTALRQWTQLLTLDLSGNTLLGPLPEAIGNLGQLQTLRVGSNRLRGTFPDSLRRLTQLYSLDVSANQFSGSLPTNWTQLTQLAELYVNGNCLTGTVPVGLTTLTHLAFINLAANQLTGTLPAFPGDQGILGGNIRADDNQFTDLGDYLHLASAATISLSVARNQLSAATLEANVTGLDQYPYRSFNYLDQRAPTPDDTIRYRMGETLTLHQAMAAPHGWYAAWEREVGGSWTNVPGATQTDLTIPTATAADRGRYRLRFYDAWLRHPAFYTRAVYADLIPYDPLPQNRPVDVTSAPSLLTAFAPPGRAGATDTVNFVRTWVPRVALTAANRVSAAPVDSVNQSTQYLDGLGRPLLSVQRQASPSRHDLVQPQAYDALGREALQYLPYVVNATSGAYRPDALAEQYHFYRDLPVTGPPSPADLTTGVARTGVPFAQTLFETSPLSRVRGKASPGESWQAATGHLMSQVERTNTVADSVWHLLAGYSSSGTDLSSTGFYSAGKLWGVQTTDEHGNRTISWTDKVGQVVLKQVEARRIETGPKAGSRWLRTAYVYDDFKQLRAVVQPEGLNALQRSGGQFTDQVSPYVFTYRFDARGRQIAKKVPGQEGETTVIYDRLDRPVLSQDVEQSFRQEWSFIKYDALSRPVLTGLVQRANADQPTLQAEADATAGQFEQRTATASFVLHYTTNQAYPQLGQGGFGAGQVLLVTYYDDYDFDNDGVPDPDAGYDASSNSSFTQPPVADLWRTTGLITRTLTKVLNRPASDVGVDWLTTTTFYDERSRPVQIQAGNARSGLDVVTTQLNFMGQAVQSVTLHRGPNHDPLLVSEFSTYDHTGRLLASRQQLPGETSATTIASIQYNELGQVLRKTIGTGRLKQDVDYAYNIRGWLTSLNDPYQPNSQDLFNLSLHYERGFTTDYAQYNGNITGQTWRGRDGVQRAYGYVYDPLNRLLQGDFVARQGAVSGTLATATPWNAEVDNYRLSFMSYDDNGNILTLRRRGLLQEATHLQTKQYGTVDNLTYSYNAYSGNKLLAVDDAVTGNQLPHSVAYHGAPTSLAGDFQEVARQSSYDYQYDFNGNLLADANKGITSIRYNHLNLPRQIQFGSGADSLVFRYAASGQKVAKLVYQMGKPVQRTDYLGPYQYEQDSLRFFPQAEGRVLRFVSYDLARQPHIAYQREYTIKDHLGNLRLAYRKGQVRTFSAGMELDQSASHQRETQQFDSLSVSAPVVQDVQNVGGRNLARTGHFAARLNAGGNAPQPLGPLTQLGVQKGDTVTINAYGFYPQAQAPHSFWFSLASFLASLVGQQPTPSVGGDPGRGRKDLPLLQVGVAAGLPNLQQASNGVPLGYLRLLVFDKDSALISAQTQQVQLTQAAYGGYQQISLRVRLAQDGYITAYVGNESDVDVYFDDIAIEHRQGLQVQENQYEPWGLSLSGLNYTSPNTSLLNSYQFNGKERQNDLGLGLSDYGARLMDTQLGRWWQIDPHVDKYPSWTAYNYGFDNPIYIMDIDGKDGVGHWESNRGQRTLVVNANYHYIKGTADSKVLQTVQKHFADITHAKLDGVKVNVRFEISFTEEKAGTDLTKFDGSNGENNLTNNANPSVDGKFTPELSDKSNVNIDTNGIRTFETPFPGGALLKLNSEQAFNYNVAVLEHGIGHNLGMTHDDGNIMYPNQDVISQGIQVDSKDGKTIVNILNPSLYYKPRSLTSDNATKLINRIDEMTKAGHDYWKGKTESAGYSLEPSGIVKMK